VKQSLDDVKQSLDDVKESLDDVKESFHRRSQLQSSSSEPEEVTERLLHHRHEGAARVLEPLASRSELQSVVSQVRADGLGMKDDVERLLDDVCGAKSSRLEDQHDGERSLHVVERLLHVV